jgi:hypothetical protein
MQLVTEDHLTDHGQELRGCDVAIGASKTFESSERDDPACQTPDPGNIGRSRDRHVAQTAY